MSSAGAPAQARRRNCASCIPARLPCAQDEWTVVMADSDVKPAFSRKEANGRWKIELVNFQKFEEVLTRDVLNAFCCCFIQSDRLLSATTCSDASEKLNGKDSVVFGRDLIAMVWFTIGTLRELALALKDLRSALKKRGLLDSGSAPWVTLRELEARWDRDEFFRKMRNVAAFHIDKKMVPHTNVCTIQPQQVGRAVGRGCGCARAS